MATRNKTKTNKTHLFDNDVLEMIEDLRKDRICSINQVMNDIVRNAHKQMKQKQQEEISITTTEEINVFMNDFKSKLRSKDEELSELNNKLMVLLKSNDDFKKKIDELTTSFTETGKRLDRHSSRLNKIEDESKKGFLGKLKGG